MAASLEGMRITLPPLCQGMSRAIDPSRGAHQRQRVHLLHALPGTLPRRPALPTHDPGATQAREIRSDVVAIDATKGPKTVITHAGKPVMAKSEEPIIDQPS